jgi:hypothetical protein
VRSYSLLYQCYTLPPSILPFCHLWHKHSSPQQFNCTLTHIKGLIPYRPHNSHPYPLTPYCPHTSPSSAPPQCHLLNYLSIYLYPNNHFPSIPTVYR